MERTEVNAGPGADSAVGQPAPRVSVVIPLRDEERNVEPLLVELEDSLQRTVDRFEVICVDDGSGDATFRVLRRLAADRPWLRLLRFGKNYGQTAALSAGFHLARGAIVVTLDGDLQNDPEDIPRLLERLEDGYDIVSGWRRSRRDRFLSRTFPSRLANWLISRITGVHLHDYGCTLKAYRREVLDRFELYGELHRFIPALGAWVGGRVAEIEVNHRPRRHGSSKYGIGRTFTVLFDLATVKFLMTYGAHPVRVFGTAGVVTGLGGLAVFAVVVAMKLGVVGGEPMNMTGNPLLYLSMVAVIVAVQFLLMGILAEMLMRTYHEAQDKRPYVVVEAIEGGNEAVDAIE